MDAMLAGMTHAEYIHWQAIYSIEPFPEDRADLRTAEQLRMMLLTAGAKPPLIADLLPDYWGERPERKQTPEQIKASLDLIKAARKKKHAT